MTNKQPQYDETFKKNIVALHQNGKTQTELSKEYGISVSAISRWIKLYSEVKVDDNTVMSARHTVNERSPFFFVRKYAT